MKTSKHVAALTGVGSGVTGGDDGIGVGAGVTGA